MQLDIDFRFHYPEAVDKFVMDFPAMTRGVIAAARMSRKSDVVELLREYDSVAHSSYIGHREHIYGLVVLLHLLPSANTRHKAKLSSVELLNSLVWFKPQQTSIELIVSEKNGNTHKQPFLLCLGTREAPGAFYLIVDVKAIELGNCGIDRKSVV